MTKIVIPIQNSSVQIGTKKLKENVIFYLDDKTEIKVLSNEEYGASTKLPPSYVFQREAPCIVTEIEGILTKESPESFEFATRVQYLFNSIKQDNSKHIIMAFAILLNGNKVEVIDIGQAEGIQKNQESDYKTGALTKWTTHATNYQLITKACNKYKKLYLTLNRYNSSYTRIRDEDKIIDITISLESMVQDDKNELAFKFALFNTFASGSLNIENRQSVFDTLKALYTTRSTIVHGGKDEAAIKKLIVDTMEKMPEIEKIAVRAIFQLAFYMNDNDPKKWGTFITKNIIAGNIDLSKKLGEEIA